MSPGHIIHSYALIMKQFRDNKFYIFPNRLDYYF